MNVNSIRALRQTVSVSLDTDAGPISCTVRRCDVDLERGQVKLLIRAEMPFDAMILGWVIHDLDLGYTIESNNFEKQYHPVNSRVKLLLTVTHRHVPIRQPQMLQQNAAKSASFSLLKQADEMVTGKLSTDEARKWSKLYNEIGERLLFADKYAK